MKTNIRKVLALLLAVGMGLSILPTMTFAAEASITITESMTASGINSDIQDAINGASVGDSITVTGEKTGENGELAFNIPAGVTLVWKAVSEDLSFKISGGGTFEIAAGGKIEVTNKDAVKVEGDVLVSGGSVSATGSYCTAIDVVAGNVIVSGGQVIADGDGMHGCYAIYLTAKGTVTVTGGTVTAHNAFVNMFAITLGGGGLAAYLNGTCEGDVLIYGTGIVVEVESLTIPSSYGGTASGLTRISGGAITSVKWDTSSVVPVISFNNGQFALDWKGYEITPPNPPSEHPVRVAETGDVFETLTEAIAAANSAGLDAFTLEVIGDVTETASPVIVASDITIVGSGSAHTVSGAQIKVESGGSLALGDGSDANPLTILGSVRVVDGTFNAKDGIVVISNKVALELSGPNAIGTISGGRFIGDSGTTSNVHSAALHMDDGATISEISGGVFTGKNEAVYLYGAGTKIHKISGGAFYQTDTAVELHGHAVLVYHESQIDEISGGYFEAVRHCAIYVINGWIGEISGGEFVATRRGTDFDGNAPNPRNSVLRIESEYDHKTGVGTISGGLFHGGAHFGILLINYFNSTTGPRIDLICGGNIQGIVALQPDIGTYIGEISGGIIAGNQGMLNAGTIGRIGGDVTIRGATSYGIFNYSGGRIYEINGGVIVSDKNNGIANSGTVNHISGGTITGGPSAFCNGISNSGTINHISGGTITGGPSAFCNGISNSGTINHISGGTIIGEESAVYNTGTIKGRLETITGGVFWGKMSAAITLAYEMKLEPGLSNIIGFGRYWGNDGVVFDDESLVIYPDGYWMSTETLPVTNITETEFKYLTNGQEPIYYTVVFDTNGGRTTGGMDTEIRTVIPPETTVGKNMPADPIRSGYTFLGWNTEKDGSGTAFTGATVVTCDITVYAQWRLNGGGGGDPRPDPDPKPNPDPDPDPNLPTITGNKPPSLFIDEHTAYVIGYPDGTVRPSRDITRAEVATIFFRLLTDEVRTQYWTQENPFPDVQKGMWYNNATSVMHHMGILKGYPDGTFKPDNAITRAEFAVTAARFARMMQMESINNLRFTDITGHWAEVDIRYAAAIGWVNGYPDGTFKPNRNITRAEAMTLVNRMLGRVPEMTDDLLTGDMKTWLDNADTNAWYYLTVQEATNSHVPEFKSKSVPGLPFDYEYWVGMLPNRDWAQLEKEWSNAH